MCISCRFWGEKEEKGGRRDGCHYTKLTREDLTTRIMTMSNGVPLIARARAFWINWPGAAGSLTPGGRQVRCVCPSTVIQAATQTTNGW